jgi:hypothetical protein
LLYGKLGATHLVLRDRRIHAGHGIDHADSERRFSAGANDERRRNLQGTQRGGAFEKHTTAMAAGEPMW